MLIFDWTGKFMDRKCALITGSTQGIGAASAIRLARDGFDVVINCRNDAKYSKGLEIVEQCRQFGGKAICVKADVSMSAECQRLVDETIRFSGRLDVLVNNAATLELAPMVTMSDELFDRLMQNGAYSTFYMMRSAAIEMKKRRSGKIINISSVGGLYGSPWSIGYAAAKGAVIAMTKTAAKELAISNITVNSIAPGGCNTSMMDMPEAQLKEQLKYVTLKRLSTPEEMAGVVSFLASDDSSYMTGHILEVSGGAMM
jgi:3-oxoacyl-[acyl-carrier protein] reductase